MCMRVQKVKFVGVLTRAAKRILHVQERKRIKLPSIYARAGLITIIYGSQKPRRISFLAVCEIIPCVLRMCPHVPFATFIPVFQRHVSFTIAPANIRNMRVFRLFYFFFIVSSFFSLAFLIRREFIIRRRIGAIFCGLIPFFLRGDDISGSFAVFSCQITTFWEFYARNF